MFISFRDHWLPWMLLRFFFLVAGILILLVLACPFVDNGAGSRTQNLVSLFARDLAVRRTAVAAALGLAATAWIFFRPKLEVPITKVPITTLGQTENRFPGD